MPREKSTYKFATKDSLKDLEAETNLIIYALTTGRQTKAAAQIEAEGEDNQLDDENNASEVKLEDEKKPAEIFHKVNGEWSNEKPEKRIKKEKGKGHSSDRPKKSNTYADFLTKSKPLPVHVSNVAVAPIQVNINEDAPIIQSNLMEVPNECNSVSQAAANALKQMFS